MRRALLLVAAVLYAAARVRLELHAQRHSTSRLCIAAIAFTALCTVSCMLVDALAGGASHASLGAVGEITRQQWGLLSVPVLASGLLGKLCIEWPDELP